MSTVRAQPLAAVVERARGVQLPPAVVALMAFALYTALTLWIMWPVPKDLSNLLYGGAGDPFGSAAMLREMAETKQPPFLPGTLQDFNNPDGFEIAWVRGLANIPVAGGLWVTAMIFDEWTAYNLLALTAFPLSGLAMFLLARRVTGNAWVALVAGFAFGFFPYAAVKAHGHYELAHGWPLVIAVWRLLELHERPTRRNGVFAGLAIVFAMAFTPYYVLLAGIAYLAIAVTALAIAARRHRFREYLVPHAITAGMVLTWLLGFYFLAKSSGEGAGLRENDVAQLNAYSARPWEYVVPHPDHKFLGDQTRDFLTERIHGSNFAESSLYLGIPVLLLALVAVVAAVRRRTTPATRAIVAMAAVGALFAAWTSAPPEGVILGQTVPFPSKLVTEISSTWRVYARLVTVVMLCVVLLAAIGLAVLMRGRRPVVQALILAVAATLIWLDFWPPHNGVNPIRTQPVYEAAAKLPKGITVQYPIVSAGASFDAIADQRWHDQPLFNGYELNSPDEARALRLADPGDPADVAGLIARGVKYAIVPPVPENEALKFRSGFELIEETSEGGRLYRLTLPRGAPQVVPVTAEGFGAEELGASGPYSWLQAPEGEIELLNRCSSCRGTLRMGLQSFGPPQRVRIFAPDGRKLYDKSITIADVAVPLEVDGPGVLRIEASPGPIPIRSITPESPDIRSVAVAVSKLRFDTAR